MEQQDASVHVTPYRGPGQLRAFADVTVQTSTGELTLTGYRVVENKAGGLFVASPSVPYTKDGQTKNKRIVEGSRATERRISEAVLAAYRKAVPDFKESWPFRDGPTGSSPSSKGV